MNRVSVVTGGTAGIGRAIVKRIISESDNDGDLVFVVYGHNDELADQLKKELPEAGREKIVFIKADLSDYDSTGIIKKAISERTDHVDWLVLNTGIGTYEKFEEYTPELWDRIMRTNAGVPVFIVKELDDMIADEGAILFMGSHSGQATYSSSLAYSVSKAAAMFAARSMVKLFDDRGIRINAVAPGFIETRWQDSRSEESYERINRKIALHRFGQPEEVADLCYHLLTNGYVNGSVYDIHGGYDYF